MYVFSRSVKLAPGDLARQMDWAVRMTEKVNQISEIRVRLFGAVMSPEVGTLGWGLSVPNLVVMEALGDKLVADSGYLELVNEGSRYISDAGPTDSLVRILYADHAVDPERAQYIQSAVAVVAPGQMEQAIGIGIEIARLSGALSGCPGTFGIHQFGQVGMIRWSTYCESIEQYEAGMEAVNADTGFQELAHRQTTGLYQADARVTLVRKIA